MIKTIKVKREHKSDSFVDAESVVHFDATPSRWDMLVRNPILWTLAIGFSVVILACILGYLISLIL